MKTCRVLDFDCSSQSSLSKKSSMGYKKLCELYMLATIQSL